MRDKMRVYLAGGISDKARKDYMTELAGKIRELGYTVYCASENDSINDKSNNPTPRDIYMADVKELLSSDIMVVNLTGGNEDGTISEIGAVAGYNEYEYLQKIELNNQYSPYKPIKIIGFTTNERLMEPQFYKGIPSAGYNHLVMGMIDYWGIFTGGESELLKQLEELIK